MKFPTQIVALVIATSLVLAGCCECPKEDGLKIKEREENIYEDDEEEEEDEELPPESKKRLPSFKIPKDTRGIKLKTPSMRRLTADSARKRIPKGCELEAEEPTYKVLDLKCRAWRKEIIHEDVKKQCKSFKRFGYKELNYVSRFSQGKCDLTSETCTCKKVKVKAYKSGTYSGDAKLASKNFGPIHLRIKGKKVTGTYEGRRRGRKFHMKLKGTISKKGSVSVKGTKDDTTLQLRGKAKGNKLRLTQSGDEDGTPIKGKLVLRLEK